MGTIKRFAKLGIHAITGGKNPQRAVEDFLLRRGFEVDTASKEKTPERSRWMVALDEGHELEIIMEGAKSPEPTVYLGLNVFTVPIRGADDVLAAALEIADGLIGVKVSLVGHVLVLSASLGGSIVTLESLDYHFRLIEAQAPWFREALLKELDWEAVEEE